MLAREPDRVRQGAYTAVARIENMYRGITARGGMKTWKLRLKE